MQMDADVFISPDDYEETEFKLQVYSSFIAFGLKRGYRKYVDFHLDTSDFDLNQNKMVKDWSGVEWLRGQLQNIINELDQLTDPERGEEQDDEA